MSLVPAALPPEGLAGLEPSWSRLVTVPDHRGDDRTWHLLDNGVPKPRLTLLCVHGNPTWSYLWRTLLARSPADVRVVAVDQLDMGFSERSGVTRRLADRVQDLVALTDRLDMPGPVVTVAHDWGGPISLGWALERRDIMAGLVLTNTAVAQPDERSAPTVIRAVRSAPLLRRATVDTSAFLIGALATSRPRPHPEIRRGYLAPYSTADQRRAIGDFVEDIPLAEDHPSYESLARIADGTNSLSDLPALLVWGPRDPVFSDCYLHDLERRLPDADVHRFVEAGHFVVEDADVTGAVLAWVGDRFDGQTGTTAGRQRPHRASLGAAIDERGRSAGSDQIAVAERVGGELRKTTFGDLRERVDSLASGMADVGVSPGSRVAVMVPPGIELTVVLYACLRLGAVMVLVDSGLGRKNMARALESADPEWLIGIPKALIAARALRWPGKPIAVGDIPRIAAGPLGVVSSVAELEERSSRRALPEPNPRSPAALVFTSGSTGPSKGVLYCHDQLRAQRDILAELYHIGPDDRLVAAFAPFALYGPALGISSTVPSMDVARPGSLTASSLAQAVRDVDATMIFASPAALMNVLATASELNDIDRAALTRIRLLLSAGAPVNRDLLAAASDLLGNAEAHTPYGMTEVLPVADISLNDLDVDTASAGGARVGRPLESVQVAIVPLDGPDEPSREPEVVGEVIVSADHVKERYDRLWYTEHLTARPEGWHRTGDVGWLDADGGLSIGGRVRDVIWTADGPVTPVGVEHVAESISGIRRAAAVGVGPHGAQIVAIVAETDRRAGGHLADTDLMRSVRQAVADSGGPDVAAVLAIADLPVDRRHNSKIDRTRLAGWAANVLAGENVRSP